MRLHRRPGDVHPVTDRDRIGGRSVRADGQFNALVFDAGDVV